MNIKHILRKDGENDIKLRSRIKKEHQIADLSKKVERLQEQLNEANELIKDYGDEYPVVVKEYLERWGVK